MTSAATAVQPTFPLTPEDSERAGFYALLAHIFHAAPDVTLEEDLARRDLTSVSLSITDTGGGIKPELMERLFEPFFTTKGELGSGTGRNAGMGLAVAHGLVGEMDGTITAANVPGRGARFDIVIPVHRETSP